MRLSPRGLALLPMLCGPALGAQTSLVAGLTAGSAKLTDQRSEQALSGVLMLQATPWLSLSALPSIVHVSDMVSGRAVSSNGLGDLSVSAAALHSFPAAGAPAIAAAFTLVLPTGNASCGLGSGQTSVGLDVGVGASPDPKLHMSADASRSLSGLSSQSTLSAPHATAVLLGGGYDVSQSWRADVSLGIDVGQSDSTQALSRVLGGGVTRRFGALALTMDGSVGLTSGSPKWVVSLGIGTAFASTSPVSPSAPLRRLKSSFTGGVNRQGGTGKIGCQ
ncbi:MAG: hypothetical protein DMD66_10950 [Gemmatimonadetes bacterium]|nr:MAG: hypothetical protein DMD66_10950 [Gemmatimonadota bacterium]